MFRTTYDLLLLVAVLRAETLIELVASERITNLSALFLGVHAVVASSGTHVRNHLVFINNDELVGEFPVVGSELIGVVKIATVVVRCGLVWVQGEGVIQHLVHRLACF